jgi:two-component system KDP operon response regulator KdpE
VVETDLTRVTQLLSATTPDLLVFEIEGAGPDTLNLIGNVRRESVIPILLLTSARAEDFLIAAYDVGVDECILKPLSESLLRSKLRAWLRHSWSMPVAMLDPLSAGNIKLNPAERTIVINGREAIHLTNLEFRLVYYLLGKRNHIMTTEELCQRIWSGRNGGDALALKNVIYRLRKKIETDPYAPHLIRTVTGVGYEFVV